MTGRKFVRELAQISGIPREKANQAAIDAIKLVGLEDSMDRAIKGYSKGMRQRIKIAQAIVHDPQILFLDEPLQSTDPIVRRELVLLIQQLGRDHGKDILISSHILHEVERVTSNILLIYAGRAIAQGDLSSIRDLMDKFPHTIRIKSSKRKEIAQILLDYDFILSIELDRHSPDYISIRTKQPDEFYQIIAKLAVESNLEISEMTSPDANLESVFSYLTRRW